MHKIVYPILLTLISASFDRIRDRIIGKDVSVCCKSTGKEMDVHLMREKCHSNLQVVLRYYNRRFNKYWQA